MLLCNLTHGGCYLLKHITTAIKYNHVLAGKEKSLWLRAKGLIKCTQQMAELIPNLK